MFTVDWSVSNDHHGRILAFQLEPMKFNNFHGRRIIMIRNWKQLFILKLSIKMFELEKSKKSTKKMNFTNDYNVTPTIYHCKGQAGFSSYPSIALTLLARLLRGNWRIGLCNCKFKTIKIRQIINDTILRKNKNTRSAIDPYRLVGRKLGFYLSFAIHNGNIYNR